MVEEASIFIGYFRRNLAAGALSERLKRLLPDACRLEVRSRYSGSRLRYCCVTFDTQDSTQAALALLTKAEEKKPRLVARLWRERNARRDRRGVDASRGGWNGPERRRADRRGPRWFTRVELEQLLAQATSGKWQGRARIRPFREEDDDGHDGYVEVRDPALNSRVKVCEVARKGDRRLVAAAPELVLQCLSLLEELECANEADYVHTRRVSRLQQAKRESRKRHKILKKLYAESLGQRLFLLAVEADNGEFRRVTKKRFIKEVRRLETGLRKRRRLSSVVEDDNGDPSH